VPGPQTRVLQYLRDNVGTEYHYDTIADDLAINGPSVNAALARLAKDPSTGVVRIRGGWYVYRPAVATQNDLFEVIGFTDQSLTVAVLKDEHGQLWRAEKLH
jgi:hypothetical protein